MNVWLKLIIAMMGVSLQACIHEYPAPMGGVFPGVGEDPTKVNVAVEVNLDLEWGELISYQEFSSKAQVSYSPRLVVEVSENGKMICHDVEYLSTEQFSHARFRHRLSKSLAPKRYQIAAWLDVSDEDGSYSFGAERLERVELMNFSSFDGRLFDCAYASEILDLSEFAGGEKTGYREQSLEMTYPGAKVRIVATDVQQFISHQKEALLQGDVYTVHLPMTTGEATAFNLYSATPVYSSRPFEFSGWMRLPFDDYVELQIAEIFLFCVSDRRVSSQLKVTDKSGLTVSLTSSFSFDIRPGYITTLYGDFLTHPVDGIFSVNTVWEGKMYIEI